MTLNRYTHILAAVDFSPATEAVLARARRESALHAAHLTLLHVIEFYPEDVPPGLVPPENADPVEAYLQRARLNLEQCARRSGVTDAKRIALTHTGAAYHEVVRYAKENDVDLIMMGYAGHWIADALGLGSTAMAVTRHTQCDVLLVRNFVDGA